VRFADELVLLDAGEKRQHQHENATGDTLPGGDLRRAFPGRDWGSCSCVRHVPSRRRCLSRARIKPAEIMVGLLLALAHDRACDAEIAHAVEADLDGGRLPSGDQLLQRFKPDRATIPYVQSGSLRSPPMTSWLRSVSQRPSPLTSTLPRASSSASVICPAIKQV
jgi:hypothetical protein